MQAVGVDQAHQVILFFLGHFLPGGGHQEVGEADDGIERGAQGVTQIAEEDILQFLALLCPLHLLLQKHPAAPLQMNDHE